MPPDIAKSLNQGKTNSSQTAIPGRERLRLNTSIPADLETIVMQAMSKSREHRYATAQDLADDLQRFLEDKPTLAQRPTLVDRGAKWARRHKTLVGCAAACLILLTIFSSVGALLIANEQARTQAALDEADANFRLAQRNLQQSEKYFQQARQVVDQFGSHLADQLIALPGSQPLRQQLLRDTLGYYRRFIEQAKDDSELESDLASTYFKAGEIASQLGSRKEAAAVYQQARTLLVSLVAAHPDDRRRQMDLATCDNNLGLLMAAQGNVAGADQSYAAAISRLSTLIEQQPSHTDFARGLAETYGNLVRVQERAFRRRC